MTIATNGLVVHYQCSCPQFGLTKTNLLLGDYSTSQKSRDSRSNALLDSPRIARQPSSD